MSKENVALPFTPPYTVRRQNEYPQIGDQLGDLYDDITNGLFGEAAKQSTWYLNIKKIKDLNPKPPI